MQIPREYLVAPPVFPAENRSGAVGTRLLKLLSVQAEHNLQWIQEVNRQSGVTDTDFAVPTGEGMRWPLHMLYNAATSALAFSVLARFGEPPRTMGGMARQRLEQMARTMIRAVAETHPVSGSSTARAEWWGKWSALRMDHIFGMGAWLLWDMLAPETQLLVARILEHDADLYNRDEAPALLYEDTQGESNAWTGSGLALAHCMLKQHPRRSLWGEKAKEFMVSAYATERDVSSERLVDGTPLNEWLRAPNAFSDYTVENHGFIHPIYMATISEMVRTAVCYHLAGERVPESATFNADHVLDALIMLNLPDGNHFYPQGTDYDPRRLDSFLQACNVIPLKPDPLREACFLRVLGSMEQMARDRPEMHISGDVTFAFDFGTSWALAENYMMRRLFGSPAKAIPEAQIETALAGVHINEPGKFVLHRTAATLSSFSWHAIDRSSRVMGITMPLDKDVLCYTPAGGAYIGDVVTETSSAPAATLEVVAHRTQVRDDGFSVMAELERCSGKVSQKCAFVSLPNGWSVYIEQRVAQQDLSLVSAESGSVWIYDDLRWPFQKRPRVFYGCAGVLRPVSGQVQVGHWLNVDDRMGYAALGPEVFTLERSTDHYHAWRLAFRHSASTTYPQCFEQWQPISSFALVSCPNQHRSETEDMAHDISEKGWQVNSGGVMAIRVNSYVVFANFLKRSVECSVNTEGAQLAPQAAGWIVA